MSEPSATVPVMEVIWLGIGFLVGMTLWMPFIVGARIAAELARIEARIGS